MSLAILIHANLSHADLSYTDLSYANLTGANLTRSNLGVSNLTGSSWTNAYYYTNYEPYWRYDMDQAWRDSVGILALRPGDIIPGPGDYNLDGIVDAADYTVWRDGDSPNSTTAGYALWVANFGQSTASGSGADHIPEPTTLLLTLLALTAVPLRVWHG